MSCADVAVLGQNLTLYLNVRASDGTPVDSDALPTYSVYEDETGTAIKTGTMAKLDDAGTTGFYSEQLAVTSGNGYERYKSYSVRYSAAVSTVSITAIDSFLCLGGSDTFTATTGALTTLAHVQEFSGIAEGTDETLLTALINRATGAIEGYCDRTFTETTYRDYYDGCDIEDIITDNYPIISIQMLAIGRDDAYTLTNSSSDAYNAYVSVNETQLVLVVQGGTNVSTTELTLDDYATLTALNTYIAGTVGKGWSGTVTTVYALYDPIELLPVSGISCLTNTSVARADYAYLKVPGDIRSSFVFAADAGLITLSGGKFSRGVQNITLRYTAGYATTPADLEQICIELVLTYYYGRKRDKGVVSEKIGDYSYKIGEAKGVGGIPAEIRDRLIVWKKRTL